MSQRITINVHTESDRRLFRMVRREVARERGVDPEDIAHTELLRELALHRLDDPPGVKIRLNGGAGKVLTALNETETDDVETALEEVATDALRLRNREKATAEGAKYTGDSQ